MGGAGVRPDHTHRRRMRVGLPARGNAVHLAPRQSPHKMRGRVALLLDSGSDRRAEPQIYTRLKPEGPNGEGLETPKTTKRTKLCPLKPD